MATPVQVDSAIPVPVLQQLEGCFQICDRLTVWAKNHSNTDEPLTDLVCSEIESLITTILLFRSQITRFGLNSLQTLAQCKLQLFETLELLAFHAQVERCGPDGALNALYARQYILGSNVCSGMRRDCDTEESLIRTGLMLKDHITELADVPLRDGDAVQRFQQLQ